MQEMTLSQLADHISGELGDRRTLTAIAGPPGSGKSTFAEALVDRLNTHSAARAEVVPMDGFHFDDTVLNNRGWRPRKGAPHTFDAYGFLHLVRRLRDNRDVEIAVPVFDRSQELSRAGARLISRDVQYIVLEGNYLLLNEEPWKHLADLFDTTVFLDVPDNEIEERLAARWAWMTQNERSEKLEGNDLPNVRTVKQSSAPADIVIRNY